MNKLAKQRRQASRRLSLAGDVEVGLVLAGEAGRRQVLGRGGAANCEAHVLAVLLLQALVGGDDLGYEVVRQPGAVDDLPRALAAPRQVGHVVLVEAVECLAQRFQHARGFEHVAICLRGDSEAIRHEHALVRERAVHLPQRSVLAAHQRNVADPDLLKESDVFELRHGPFLPLRPVAPEVGS